MSALSHEFRTASYLAVVAQPDINKDTVKSAIAIIALIVLPPTHNGTELSRRGSSRLERDVSPPHDYQLISIFWCTCSNCTRL